MSTTTLPLYSNTSRRKRQTRFGDGISGEEILADPNPFIGTPGAFRLFMVRGQRRQGARCPSRHF